MSDEPNDADESMAPGHREVLRAASGAVIGDRLQQVRLARASAP